MNAVYRLVWNATRAQRVPASELSRAHGKSSVTGRIADSRHANRRLDTRLIALGLLMSSLALAATAKASAFLDLSPGLPGWTASDVTLFSTTFGFDIGGQPFSLTPDAGYNMVRISPTNGLTDVNATLGLSANSLESFLNNGDGAITDFALLTTTRQFAAGTYSFAWAYAAEDYQPYNDGAIFSLVGGASQSLLSLARNGSSPEDQSGPSPGTLILGSFGSTTWMTTSFSIATAGNYQLGFAAYNWNDTALSPDLFVSAIEGSFTGTPVDTGGGTPKVLIIGTTGGNVSNAMFDTASDAYAETTLAFDGGTLQYQADTTTDKDATLTSAGGVIDTNGYNATVTGSIAGDGGLTKDGVGTLTLSGANAYSGTTLVNAGTLALSGSGSIASSSGLLDNGSFDIAGTSTGASIQDLAGNGAVLLGDQTLTITQASSTFSGAIAGTGALTLAGGSLGLSGANAYTGATLVNAGTLALSGSGSIASSSGLLDNGSFDIAGMSAGASIQNLAGNGTVLLGDQTLTITHAASTFSGVIAGTGAVTLAGGSLTLDGTNTYSGGINVLNGATLRVGNDTALGNASSVLRLTDATLQNLGTMTLSHDILVQNVATVDSAAGTSLLTAGSVSGNGTLVKTGQGTLVLAGDNGAWGLASGGSADGLVLDGGTVVVTSSSGLGHGAIVLNAGTLAAATDLVLEMPLTVGGNTAFDAAAGTRTAVSGSVSGASGAIGCFKKLGDGTLVLGGTSNLSAGICVQQGSLHVNGLLNGGVAVDAAGTLRGTGTITGPIVVHGTLAPGNSPGTLVTAATVTMTAGSTFQEDINGTATDTGPGSYSRLIVTGAGQQFIATGATLAPNLLDIVGSQTYVPYTPRIGDLFRIVTAEGGVVGTFATVLRPDGLAEGTRLQVFYDVGGNNSIDLVVVPNSYAAYVAGQNGNANGRSVGGGLDAMMGLDATGTASATQQQLLYAVSTQPGVALPLLATSLAGEIHAALAAAAPLAPHALLDTVARHLDQEQSDGRGLWVDVGARQSSWMSDAIATGFRATGSRYTVGMDTTQDSRSRTGFGLSYDTLDVSHGHESGGVTHNMAFAYGHYRAGTVLLDGMVSYGSSNWQSHRADPLGPSASLDTDLNGRSTSIAAAARLPLALGAALLTPYGRASWERDSRAGFSEGSVSLAALTGSKYVAQGMRLMAGMQLGSPNKDPLASRLTYQLDLGVGRDADSVVNPAVAVNLAGIDTTIRAPEVGCNFARVEAAGTARIAPRLYGYGALASEFRSGRSSDLAANVGLRLAF